MPETWGRRAAQAAMAARCLVLVTVVRLGLCVLPYRVLSRCVPPTSGARADDGKLRRTAWGVSHAAAWVPGATCLTQALAAQFILARSGFASDIRVGVRQEAGRFSAHAWLLSGDVVVLGGEAENLAGFTVLTDLSPRTS